MDYSQDETFRYLHRLEVLRSRVCCLSGPCKGIFRAEHVLYAILHRWQCLGNSHLERAEFFLWRPERSGQNCCSSSQFRGTCRLDREDLKAVNAIAVTVSKNSMANMMGIPQNPVAGLEEDSAPTWQVCLSGKLEPVISRDIRNHYDSVWMEDQNKSCLGWRCWCQGKQLAHGLALYC